MSAVVVTVKVAALATPGATSAPRPSSPRTGTVLSVRPMEVSSRFARPARSAGRQEDPRGRRPFRGVSGKPPSRGYGSAGAPNVQKATGARAARAAASSSATCDDGQRERLARAAGEVAGEPVRAALGGRDDEQLVGREDGERVGDRVQRVGVADPAGRAHAGALERVEPRVEPAGGGGARADPRRRPSGAGACSAPARPRRPRSAPACATSGSCRADASNGSSAMART